MYTLNDHAGYGVMEVVQNLLLDFEDAASNWKEQCAVSEALASLMNTGIGESMARYICSYLTPSVYEPKYQSVNANDLPPGKSCDDGDLVSSTFELVGQTFLCLLGRLERDGLLARGAPPNLGLIMALYMAFADEARGYSCLLQSIV